MLARGRSQGDREGRPEGFCAKCGTAYSFTPKLKAGDLVAGQYLVAGALAHGGLGWNLAPALLDAEQAKPYIDRFGQFLDKLQAFQAMVADTRDVLKTSLEQTRDAWRSALSSGTSTSDLEAACKTMHDSARAAMGAYGCTDF